MIHPQLKTPLQTDNSTDNDIVNKTIHQKLSKFVEMRFYWIKYHLRKSQLHVLWHRKLKNLSNYHTKHHLASHHWKTRSTFLQHNALTSKEKIINQIIFEGAMIPPPGPRYPKLTWIPKTTRRPLSRNSFYVSSNIPHKNICSRFPATDNLVITNLQVR